MQAVHKQACQGQSLQIVRNGLSVQPLPAWVCLLLALILAIDPQLSL